jgi:hypothetical protein
MIFVQGVHQLELLKIDDLLIELRTLAGRAQLFDDAIRASNSYNWVRYAQLM